jgi:hypothetical protein
MSPWASLALAPLIKIWKNWSGVLISPMRCYKNIIKNKLNYLLFSVYIVGENIIFTRKS